jgi:hypothetical protein
LHHFLQQVVPVLQAVLFCCHGTQTSGEFLYLPLQLLSFCLKGAIATSGALSHDLKHRSIIGILPLVTFQPSLPHPLVVKAEKARA